MLAQTQGIDGLLRLLQRCKREARKEAIKTQKSSARPEDPDSDDSANKWKERGESVGRVLSATLVDLGVSGLINYP